MIHIHHGCSLADPLAAAMFRDRKRQFVDQFGWDVPVVAGQYEFDQYDGDDADYLIAVDGEGGHAGSMRLLPTIGPHLLADHFAGLCEGDIPGGPHVMEITRLRSEEHTSELQSLMWISYAVFCLKNKTSTPQQTRQQPS